ncbi:xylulose kinase-1 [Tanacetum coccineum]
MSEPMPTIPTQSPFTYPNPNPSASPSFTQDDTSESFIPEPTQPMPTFTQTAFSQPAFSQPNQSIFSQPAFQQFQTATISANNAKFPYLEKEKYEIWAMKMEYWIQNADHNLWRIVQQGNSPKRLGKDAKGNTIVHPPVSLDEHVAVQRENKVRTLLLQALPEDHMPDFHHYDDARDIWMAVKAEQTDICPCRLPSDTVSVPGPVWGVTLPIFDSSFDILYFDVVIFDLWLELVPLSMTTGFTTAPAVLDTGSSQNRQHTCVLSVKLLYGHHQAPRAWYSRCPASVTTHYRRGTIDKTLFIKKDSRDIILVQVYVDDIIFGSTNKAWCAEFEVLMKGEFEMSAMER